MGSELLVPVLVGLSMLVINRLILTDSGFLYLFYAITIFETLSLRHLNEIGSDHFSNKRRSLVDW